MKETYWAEIEFFSTNSDWKLTWIDAAWYVNNSLNDSSSMKLHHDSCTHLLELNWIVSEDLSLILSQIVNDVDEAIRYVHNKDLHVLNSSTHPTMTHAEAYQNNIRKPIYALLRPASHENDVNIQSALQSNHRNWKHELSSLHAGIQPWNSIEIDSLQESYNSLLATDFLIRYLSANSPFFEGKIQWWLDNRWRMYDQEKWMLSTSIYSDETSWLIKKYNHDEITLSKYLDGVFSQSNLFWIWTKKSMFVHQSQNKIYEVFWDSGKEKFLDINTLKTHTLDPFESFSFNELARFIPYFTSFWIRLVWGETITWEDFKLTMKYIQEKNETNLLRMFKKYWIKFAVEWRWWSTVMPEWDDYSLMLLPLILQSYALKESSAVNKRINQQQWWWDTISKLNKSVLDWWISEEYTEFALWLMEVLFDSTQELWDSSGLINQSVEKAKDMIRLNENKAQRDIKLSKGSVDKYTEMNLL